MLWGQHLQPSTSIWLTRLCQKGSRSRTHKDYGVTSANEKVAEHTNCSYIKLTEHCEKIEQSLPVVLKCQRALTCLLTLARPPDVQPAMATKPPTVGISRLPLKSTQPPRVLSCDVKEQLSVLVLGCQVFWAELTKVLRGQAFIHFISFHFTRILGRLSRPS